MYSLLEIEEKTYFDFYDEILSVEVGERVWFYKETKEDFLVIFPEGSLIIFCRIPKTYVYSMYNETTFEGVEEEDERKEEILQRFREEHLKRAIPFKTFHGVIER